MPMIIKGFLLFFGPLFGLIAFIAFAAFLRRAFRRRRDVALEASGRFDLTAVELVTVVEFHARRRRFHAWLWTGVLASIVALFEGWYLTAVAFGLLAPLAAVVLHLRCPACDTTPTIKGLIERGCCRRCGAYLGA